MEATDVFESVRRSGRPARGRGSAGRDSVGPLALHGDADLDPFFAILVVAALVIAVAVSRPPFSPIAWTTGRLLALAWLGAAASAAFLLAMYQSACGCSMVEPSSQPPLATDGGLSATAFHLLATYGGGLLVALAVFMPDSSTWSDVRATTVAPDDPGHPREPMGNR